MLPSFVIGLREGLEAALIVGIIAAFLVTRGRGLRPMWLGVALAIALCVSLAVTFTVVGSQLSFKARETAEGMLSLVAVAGVTYMIVWMRRHARELKGQLETRAALALSAGSGLALAFMAFFAVLREGLETAVFLLAAFQQTADPARRRPRGADRRPGGRRSGLRDLQGRGPDRHGPLLQGHRGGPRVRGGRSPRERRSLVRRGRGPHGRTDAPPSTCRGWSRPGASRPR